MRLFIGIPLPDAVIRELFTVVSRLRPAAGRVRWSAPESWHITLQFLGNATEDQLACLARQLAEVCSAPVRIEIGELGSFERSGVFFVGVAVTPGLTALQESVVAATGHCGFIAEARPYRPHITLARKSGNRGTRDRGTRDDRVESKGMQDLVARAGADRFSAFTANEFLLYESHLGSEGSRYEVRARFPIGARRG